MVSAASSSCLGGDEGAGTDGSCTLGAIQQFQNGWEGLLKGLEQRGTFMLSVSFRLDGRNFAQRILSTEEPRVLEAPLIRIEPRERMFIRKNKTI